MQSLRYTLISGQDARNFRKKLASRCDRPSKSVLTTKFRLGCPPQALNQLNLEKTKALYGVIEGIEPGSLTYFIFVLQACGFRIFPKFAKAKEFAARHAYQSEQFLAAIERFLGKGWKEFSPNAIVDRLQTDVRARGGKDNRFVAEVIAQEYCKTFKAIGDANKESIVQSIARKLAEKFTSWSDLKKRYVEACQTVDIVLETFSEDFPKITPMAIAAEAAVSLPDNSTIAFDVSSQPYQCNSEILPYCAVATALAGFDEATSENAQAAITTKGNHEGLSWLLGRGLNYIRKSTVEELQASYGVPQDKILAVRQMKAAADAIPPQTFLKISAKDNYSVFRQNAGGHLDSWIANYVSRLTELEEILGELPQRICLPEILEKPECLSLFAGISRTAEEVKTELDDLNACTQQAKASLNKLLGRGSIPLQDDIENVVRFHDSFNDFVSFREELSNAITQREKDASHINFEDIKTALSQWQKFKKIPKLNKLTGGVPDVTAEIEADLTDFHEIKNKYDEHVSRVREWLKSEPSLPAVLMKLEQSKLEQRPNKHLEPLEQAVRYMLHRIGHTARMHPGPVFNEVRKWFMNEGIFIEKKAGSHTSLNTFFINRKWSLYISPFSSRHNFEYPIKTVTDLEAAETLWTRLWELVVRIAHDPVMIASDYDAVQALFRNAAELELTRIQLPVPSAIAKIDLPRRFAETLPNQYFTELAKGSVSSNIFRRAFNSYVSVLSGLNTRLRRENFFLRTKFTWIDNTELLYVPKNTFWAVPERYRTIAKWKDILQSDAVWNESRLDVLATFEILKGKIRDRSNLQLLEFLVQMPHDWCYELPVAPNDQTRITAVSVKKKDCKTTQVFSGKLARLEGPSSLRSRLDARLLATHSEDVGDMTILCDYKVQQKIIGAHATFDFDSPRISLAIPISELPDGKQATPNLFSRIVAIDQGEAGLAYAVFDLEDFGKQDAVPKASGTVRINSIRRLIKAGQVYRKGNQLNQKFNQRFDSTMFTLRENVTGDVCSVIEGLMHKYHAFPILEGEVRNLESGSRQLTLVYKAVNNRFLLSDSAMPNSERAAWWYGANSWTLNGFTFIKNDGTHIPLRLYPGRSVSAANTSRICSVCRRNAFDLIKELEARHIKKIPVREDGIISVPGIPKLRLFREIRDPGLRMKYTRQNLFAPMLEPIPAGDITIEELRSLMRKNMRRRHASRQSKDTTQSVYYCVFLDCPSHDNEWIEDPKKYKGLKILRERHADINAAINIGRRFLNSDNIIRENMHENKN